METNVIYCGDNLEVMPKYIPDESVDLIYIDPPFNSSRGLLPKVSTVHNDSPAGSSRTV
jgi:DNA modification methylase